VTGIRAIIADSDAMTRLGIRSILSVHGEFEIVAEAGTAASAVAATELARPDVCLISVELRGKGIVAAARITAGVPDTAVVMLTEAVNEDDLFDALRAGARGYLLKTIHPDALVHVLHQVVAGEVAVPRRMVARIVEQFRESPRHTVATRDRLHVDLTTKQWQVLGLMRQGCTTAEMAAAMFVSPVTVRSHVSAILRKLNVPDRGAALRLVADVAGAV
jgi:two-component system NarL family response regulator